MDFLEGIKHLIVPRTSNNQRARVLHPASFVLYIIVLVFLQASLYTIHIVQPNILGYATNITVDELYRLTNEKRGQHGLSPLQFSDPLSQAANGKAIDMYNKNYWSHNSPDGLTPWQFILDAGYRYLVAGENLAKNFNDSQSVVEAWMNSTSHKDNLLKTDFEDVGFAIVDGKLQGEETTLVVQMFGTKKGARIAQIQSQAAATTNVKPTISQPTPLPVAAIKAEPLISSRLGLEEPTAPYEIAGIRNEPLFDLRLLEKQLIIFMLLFLVSVLLIDGYFVYKHKKIRIAGRNWAHIIFILSLLGIIYFAKAGAIL